MSRFDDLLSDPYAGRRYLVVVEPFDPVSGTTRTLRFSDQGFVTRPDEERHEQFFSTLVAHCLEHHRDSTLSAIARRAFGFGVVGADIIEYRENKLRSVADCGVFNQAAADRVVSDRIVAWGLAEEPLLAKYVLG